MRDSAARRVLRTLLALYPAAFRERLGEDLVETALYRWRDARQAGSRAELVFWVGEGLRFAVDGVVERVRGVTRPGVEVVHAWRQVRRAPQQHALAVLTLAAGIGATSLMAIVAYAVVLRPLPYPDAAALHVVHTRFGTLELSANSLPNLHDVRSSLRSLDWLEAASSATPALTEADGDAERVRALAVTERYLDGLGAVTVIGRGFSVTDYAAGVEPVALVSEALWRRRWGGSTDMTGRRIELDGVAHTVVGVLSARFRDPEPLQALATDVWVPARLTDGLYRHRDAYRFGLIGRVRDGVSLQSARRELASAGVRLSAAHPDVNRIGGEAMELVPYALHEQTVGDARTRLLVLLGAVSLLLLLSCANAASLFLARGLTRGPELAVRAALGASRGRLALQLFTENAFTAILAGLLGGIAAWAGLQVFVARAPAGMPRLYDIAADVQALLVVVAVTLLAAVVFGSLPALRGARAASATGAAARITMTRGTQRLQSLLVGIEVALALVLVTGSALLLGSLRNMLHADPGFDAGDVHVVEIAPPAAADSHARELAFYADLLERVGALPGVGRAALLHSPPGQAGGLWTQASVAGALPAGERDRPRAAALGDAPGSDFMRMNIVFGDVFAALDMRVLAGAGFGSMPGPGDPLVVVINEAAARRFFPGLDMPVGQHLTLGPAGAGATPRQVVGIVNDVRQRAPGADVEPQIYVPYTQRDADRLSFVIEHAGTPPSARDILHVLRDVAPDVPLDRAAPLSAMYDERADAARFMTLLLSSFAVAGLLLALVGTYATTAHASARRARELSIRIALGARARTVLWLVLGRSVRTAALGAAAGLAASLLFSRVLRGYLVGVSANDPATMLAAAALVSAAALLAAAAPALRAIRVQPREVLNGD